MVKFVYLLVMSTLFVTPAYSSKNNECWATFVGSYFGKKKVPTMLEGPKPLGWLDAKIDVSISEYADLYQMRRSKAIQRLKRDYGVQVILKDRTLTFKEFLGSPILKHWTSSSLFLRTPFVELKKLQDAHKFYSTADSVKQPTGLYIGAEEIFMLGREAVAASQRPYGHQQALIIVNESFAGEVMLHELTHHLINLANTKTKLSDSKYLTKTDWLKSFGELYQGIDFDGVKDLKFQNDLLGTERAMFMVNSLYIREELSINQLLLEYRKEIDLDRESVDNLLQSYFRDYHQGINLLEKQIDKMKKQEEVGTFANSQARAELRQEIDKEIEKFKSGVTQFIYSSAELKDRAAALGLRLF